MVDVLNRESVQVTEGKTKKVRKIMLNPNLRDIITTLHEKMEINDDGEYLFINKFKSKPINIQFINRKLKEIAIQYKFTISPNGTSSHLFRKILGRHVWTVNNFSEKSLLLLGELFNHSSIKITKIYLGIKEEEIGDVYLNL